MKNGFVLFLSLAMAILFTGCATTPTGILITAQRDPDFAPTRTNTICLALQNNQSAENTQLGKALMAEFSNEHFNIVTNADTDYTLTYLIEDDSTSEIVPRAIHIPSSTQASPPAFPIGNPSPYLRAEMPPTEAPGEPSLQTTIVQTEYIRPDQGIRLYLYANPKKYPGLTIAWQGCIEAGESVSPEREPLLIKTLLGYFGQDYTGRIFLQKP